MDSSSSSSTAAAASAGRMRTSYGPSATAATSGAVGAAGAAAAAAASVGGAVSVRGCGGNSIHHSVVQQLLSSGIDWTVICSLTCSLVKIFSFLL